jgi:hypothetical protein
VSDSTLPHPYNSCNPPPFSCSVLRTAGNAMELACAFLVVVMRAMGAPRVAHALRYGWIVGRFVPNGSLVSASWGLAIPAISMHSFSPAFSCSVRHIVGFATKLDPASAILAVVTSIALGSPQVAHAHRCGVDLWISCSTVHSRCVKMLGACISTFNIPLPLYTQLPPMCSCSVWQTVISAPKLEPGSAILMVVLRGMGSPQHAHAPRCGVDLLVHP